MDVGAESIGYGSGACAKGPTRRYPSMLWSSLNFACALEQLAVTSPGRNKISGIPGHLAYDCLRSMPFRSDLAVRFVDDYAKYLQFHATASMLKDPPSGYISTGVDLWGGLQRIRQKASDNVYSSQYDFDSDLKYLTSRANDGHLSVGLCSLEIMHFEHDMPLVSISPDGVQLPRIYTYYDAEMKLRGTEAAISSVYRIEDMDPVYYLQANIGVTIGLQDPDARYNHLFPSPAAAFSGMYTGGLWTNNLGSWPGKANQTVEFSNGTRLTVETTASVTLDRGLDFSSGESLFQTACLPNKASRPPDPHPALAVGKPPYSIPLGGSSMYPAPIVHHEKELVRGYYLHEERLDDVAVLQLPTFRLTGESPVSLARVAVQFLERARKDGKEKLIIDLSNNMGGDINLGFNLFRIFFPDKRIYTATRFPSTELIGLMGRVFSSPQGHEAVHHDNTLDLPLIFQNAVTPDHRHSFSSWEKLFGPAEIAGQNMSHLHATYNFTTASTEDNPISGYGGIEFGPSTQAFHAENIIVMTNGICASTCTILARLLKEQGSSPMQLLGGSKGGQYWSLVTVSHYIEKAREIAVDASRAGSPVLSADELARFLELAPPPLTGFPMRIDSRGGSGVNFRNEYDEKDPTTPLQFVYEAADCRLFWTAKNYVFPGSSWVAAADAMFGDASCVEESAGHRIAP
ncbi:peptidase S41 family protein [Aspergillus arachidicola]|uniref:Peptidase S41 family protein n=1 Tax=Aspergillus arachidicola TaxID=656916 RepID=A0A2G7GBJ5_9EURO|nr:peptidase S41 family protein [Aspergillus arachidicola]